MLRGRIVVQLVSRSTSLLYVWSESAKLEASHAPILAPVVSVLWSWSRTGAVGKHHRDVSRCIQSSPVDTSIDCIQSSDWTGCHIQSWISLQWPAVMYHDWMIRDSIHNDKLHPWLWMLFHNVTLWSVPTTTLPRRQMLNRSRNWDWPMSRHLLRPHFAIIYWTEARRRTKTAFHSQN